MIEGEPGPGGRVGAPDGLRVGAGVQPEEVRHACGQELAVHTDADTADREAAIAQAKECGFL